MKKLFSIVSLLVLLSSMVIPVLAYNDDEKPKDCISGIDNKHQCAGVLEWSEGTTDSSVYPFMHLKLYDMQKIIAESEDIVPEDFNANRLTMIRQRNIFNEEGPIEISLCAWNSKNRYLLLFFRELLVPDDYNPEFGPWTLIACDYGEFLDAELPCSGQYALAWTW